MCYYLINDFANPFYVYTCGTEHSIAISTNVQQSSNVLDINSPGLSRCKSKNCALNLIIWASNLANAMIWVDNK